MINYIQAVIFLLCFCIVSTSCRRIAECSLLPIKAELEDKDLPSGEIGEKYVQKIECNVTNAPNDNYQIESFSIEGDLPDKLVAISKEENNSSFMVISGEPGENGVSGFTLSVIMEVKPRFKNDTAVRNLCNQLSVRDYQIVVK